MTDRRKRRTMEKRVLVGVSTTFARTAFLALGLATLFSLLSNTANAQIVADNTVRPYGFFLEENWLEAAAGCYAAMYKPETFTGGPHDDFSYEFDGNLRYKIRVTWWSDVSGTAKASVEVGINGPDPGWQRVAFAAADDDDLRLHTPMTIKFTQSWGGTLIAHCTFELLPTGFVQGLFFIP
jgi:hypothetical protein